MFPFIGLGGKRAHYFVFWIYYNATWKHQNILVGWYYQVGQNGKGLFELYNAWNLEDTVKRPNNKIKNKSKA